MRAILEMGRMNGIIEVPNHTRTLFIPVLQDIGAIEIFNENRAYPSESNAKILVFEIQKRLNNDTAIFKFSRIREDM